MTESTPAGPDGGRATLRERTARGLADRLRTLLLALDRQDRLETASAFVGWLERRADEGGLGEDARELLLRALRAAADPVNFRLLAGLDPWTAADLPRLMELTGLERVAVSERIHDLVQTGLASRELIDDQIRGTELGAALVEWIGEVAAETAELLSAELAGRRARPAGGKGDG